MELRFGNYRLIPSQRLLSKPEGDVELPERSCSILAALVRRPGEIVSKDELLSAVWPGQIVEENTLQVYVSDLRKVLPSGMISTVHGKGYRYTGPAPATSQPPEQGAPTQLPDRRPKVVVLPFDSLFSDQTHGLLIEGMAAEIAGRLARFRNLIVVGQHSAAAARSMGLSLSGVGRKVDADFVVSGGVQGAPRGIRIAIRLTDANSERTIWADRYERDWSDLFLLQDEIAMLVAAAVASYLEIEVNMRANTRIATNLSSYEYLQRGLWHFKKLTAVENEMARNCFERAIELDPNNAQAFDWLGITYSEDWIRDYRLPESGLRGVELTAKAVALDPADGQIMTGHAWALLRMGKLDRAMKASESSVSLNPGDPTILATRALILAYDGRVGEAHEVLLDAQKLEPIPPPWINEVRGILAFVEGRYEEALSGVEPIEDCALDLIYTLSCYGHLKLDSNAQQVVTRLAEQGRSPRWKVGINFEPHRMDEVRLRLAEGVERSLAKTETKWD